MVVGWLLKLVLVLGLLGGLALDGISLLRASFNASDQATTAALAAADGYRSSHNLQRAYDAALAAVTADGDTIETSTFTVAPDGRVHLVLHRTASTLWLSRIPPLRHLADVRATGAAAPPS